MIGVRVALLYCCFVGVLSTLSLHGSTHPVNDSTEYTWNGTDELDGVRNRAAVLPVASAKADKADGSKYKVLHNKDDFPSGYNGPVKYERGQFVVEVDSNFQGYLVREKGGDLNVGITVDELSKLSSDKNNLDQLKLEFVATKRYMDIGVSHRAGTYLFELNEGTNTKMFGGIESTTREFRVKVPSVAHASLTTESKNNAHWKLETDISYSSLTGTMITDSSEVIPFKFFVVKSAAKFSLFFEPGQVAVIDPGPDKAAIIGGSVGGILGLGLVVAVGYLIWRHVKKQKEKKKDVPKAAVVAETRGETGTDFESGNLETPNEDRDQPGDVKAAKKRKMSKELKKEPETSKDSKTSEVKSVVTQNNSKEKVPSKREVDKPVSQFLKQEDDKKSVVEAKEDLKKEPVGVDVGVHQVDKKVAQTKDACDTNKVPESKEQVVPNKQPKEGSGIVKVAPVINQDVVADNKKGIQAPLPESVEKMKENAVNVAAVTGERNETVVVVTNDKKGADVKKESKSVKAATDGDKQKSGAGVNETGSRDGLGGNKDATKCISQGAAGNVKGDSIKNAASIKKPRQTGENKKKQEGVERKKERRGNRRKASRDASESSADKTREVTVEVEPETVTVADPAAAKTDEDGPINREPIKIEDIPPPSVRVVTAPIWTFTSRNSAKYARPPIARSLPVDMGAPNPAYFQEGQGTAYQDAVEAVRKEQEEAEKRAEEMRVYEEHEAKRPSIYRTKYLVGPDPLGAPMYKSEEDDTVFKSPKRKRKKRSNP